MESPFFPIGLREVPANVRIEELKEMSFNIGPVRVQAAFANHPGICVGYRLFASDGSIAFFPDNEPHPESVSPARPSSGAESPAKSYAQNENGKLIDFLRGTDVLIMDTQYDTDEYKRHTGWGHGCLDDVVALALRAEVKTLFLFHHDPRPRRRQSLPNAGPRPKAGCHAQRQNSTSRQPREGAAVELPALVRA